MRRLAAELGVPLGIVLEGGYDLGALARSVAATLEVLAARPTALGRRAGGAASVAARAAADVLGRAALAGG